MKKILVFAPHPDDEVIGCGGAIVLHQQQGDEVKVVFMTSGEAGSLSADASAVGRNREHEAKAASQSLGIGAPEFLRLPDGYLENSAENLKKLLKVIRDQKPDVVYLPHPADGHRDHQVTHQLVTEAVSRAGGKAYGDLWTEPWTVSSVLGYEVWTPLSTFQLVIDITDVIDQKITALQQHSSQLTNVKYDEAAKSLSRFRGAMTQVGDYCECFEVIKISSL